MGNGSVETFNILEKKDYRTDKFKGYEFSRNYKFKFKDGMLVKNRSSSSDKNYSREEVEAMNLMTCKVELENGATVDIAEYGRY